MVCVVKHNTFYRFCVLETDKTEASWFHGLPIVNKYDVCDVTVLFEVFTEHFLSNLFWNSSYEYFFNGDPLQKQIIPSSLLGFGLLQIKEFACKIMLLI